MKTTYASSISKDPTTYEPNDTLETSTFVKSGVFYNSTLETENDKDVFQFTTNRDGEVYIMLDQTTDGFSMELYNMYGVEISEDRRWEGGDDLVIADDLPKGTYYIKLKQYHWDGTSSANYRLKATYASDFSRNSTTFEPNDTFETAMSLISGKTYTSDSYSDIDRDVYQFTTNKAGKATIKVDNIQDSFEMSLYDSNHKKVASDTGSLAGASIEIEEILAKGTYYLKIDPYYWNNEKSSKYRLKAIFIDKTPSIVPLYDIDTVITGTAVSNTKVIAVKGSEKIGETTAKDGKYTIKTPKQKTGTKIGVYTIDSAGNQSATQTITVIDATIKAISIDYNKLKVSWLELPGAQGYEIYRSTSSKGIFNIIATVTKGSTSNYTNDGLSTGTTYYYKVRAYFIINNKKVYGSYSDTAYAKPVLAAVSSTKATSAGYNKNKISWTKKSGASGYEVYRADSKSGKYKNIKTITSNSTTSYENSSLTTGKTYYYKVRAYRTVSGKKVFGAYSKIVSSAPTLAKPSKIIVAKASSTSIKVSWSKVSEASGYELYRSTSKAGSYSKVYAATKGTTLTYTNSKLSKGKTYYYKVRAYRTVKGKKVYSSYTAVSSSKL